HVNRTVVQKKFGATTREVYLGPSRSVSNREVSRLFVLILTPQETALVSKDPSFIFVEPSELLETVRSNPQMSSVLSQYFLNEEDARPIFQRVVHEFLRRLDDRDALVRQEAAKALVNFQ